MTGTTPSMQAQDTRRAVETVLAELGGRYVTLDELVDRVAALLADEPDAGIVDDEMRAWIEALDPFRGEAERYDRDVEDRIVADLGLADITPDAIDADWTARMAHYRGDTRYERAV